MTDVDFHTHLSDRTGNYQTALSVHYVFSEGESVCVCVCMCLNKYLICGYVLCISTVTHYQRVGYSSSLQPFLHLSVEQPLVKNKQLQLKYIATN